jgi:hypothetical protein
MPRTSFTERTARARTLDYVGIIELDKTHPLPAVCWAACGKDLGFSPLSLLKMLKRFARKGSWGPSAKRAARPCGRAAPTRTSYEKRNDANRRSGGSLY